MEDVDTQEFKEYDDEAMFLSDVIQDEHDLLFLDSYLTEAFRGRPTHPGAGSGSGFFDEGKTI